MCAKNENVYDGGGDGGVCVLILTEATIFDIIQVFRMVKVITFWLLLYCGGFSLILNKEQKSFFFLFIFANWKLDEMIKRADGWEREREMDI